MAPPSPTTTAAARDGGSTTIADVHRDVLREHIFTRLDGPTLAAASCTSSQFHSLSADKSLWGHICHATWPSTNTPLLRHVIASFPDGPRSFYADSSPILAVDDDANTHPPANPHRPIQLISAVDIRYRGDVIFSRVVVDTETVSDWFKNSPFRIDLLSPKEVVPTPIEYPESDEKCRDLAEEVDLSWIVIDSIGRRAVNVSSRRAVRVERHWLTGEVQARFAAVVGGGERGTAAEAVEVGVVVTCGGEMQVREVSLQVEDMDGRNLNGRDSLGILQRSLEGKMGRKFVGEGEGKRRYEEYLERKRERKGRKARSEGRLDTLCVAFSVMVVALSSLLILCT